MNSFYNIKNWIKLFDDNQNAKEGIVKYLVGNKSDQERKVNDHLIEQFINEYKEFKYSEVSAKSNDGIEKLFLELGEDLYTIQTKKGGISKSQNTIIISKYIEKKNSNICNCLYKDSKLKD